MQKHILFIYALMLILTNVSAQQIANSSHIAETRVAWNPAYTAPGNNMIFDGFFRSQWLGFSGAPVSGYVSFQYPLLNYNMSGGALLMFDHIFQETPAVYTHSLIEHQVC